MTLRVRWLGRVPYPEALALQRGLFTDARDDYLLLMEHPHVYTLGVHATPAHVLVDPADVGAEVAVVDRGGGVTYHGPGQLVGYPILTVADHAAGAMASTRDYVRSIEDLLVGVLRELGLDDLGMIDGSPGVWVDPGGPRPRKIAAVGVKIARGRTMHGFALNVDADLSMFGHIVPCGIVDKGVTSLAAEGIDVGLRRVVDVVAAAATRRWASAVADRADVSWRAPHRVADAGVGALSVAITDRKPEWMTARVRLGGEVLGLRSTLRELELTTVCEEAGCPNLSECWADGTATFMVCGERCTRACGFCLVDTRRPDGLDVGEPERVADAVERMDLAYAVVTMVASDDLADGGAAHVAATIEAIRRRRASTEIEALISDCRGDAASLATVFDARPDVLNHNIETVARLQRAARPSAGYARSLSVLARARAAGLVTKSGIVVGMGETFDEVTQTLADLASVGVSIVTIGQYLRPTSNHLPVDRWWTPDDFDAWKRIGERELGIVHVESSPLTRSSYHARSAAAAVTETAVTETAVTETAVTEMARR